MAEISEILHQLRLVVYSTVYRVLAPSQVVVGDFWTINSFTTWLSSKKNRPGNSANVPFLGRRIYVTPSKVVGDLQLYLEDHPSLWVVNNHGPWLVSPLSRVVPLPNGLNGLQMGVTNYLLTGMILQVGDQKVTLNHLGESFAAKKSQRLVYFYCWGGNLIWLTPQILFITDDEISVREEVVRIFLQGGTPATYKWGYKYNRITPQSRATTRAMHL